MISGAHPDTTMSTGPQRVQRFRRGISDEVRQQGPGTPPWGGVNPITRVRKDTTKPPEGQTEQQQQLC